MTDSGGKQHKLHRPARAIDANSAIAKTLKSYYESVENEPVPDVFLNLLEKLDEAERKAKSSI